MLIFAFTVIAIITWSLMLIPYMLWLQRSTFFHLQRGYLLGSLIIGLLSGVVNILPQSIVRNELVKLIPTDSLIPDNLDSIISGISISEVPVSSTLMASILAVYYIVSCIMLSILVYKVLSLYMMARGNSSTYMDGMRVVESPQRHTPFSFFHLIFLSKENRPDGSSLGPIVRHESVHTRQWHSVDIILTEVLLVFTWFFPVVFLYKKYLTLLHEYLADAEVIKTMDARVYGELLLSQQMGASVSVAHHFAKSELKSRFRKMVQKPSSGWHRLNYFSFFPFLLLSLFLAEKVDLTALTANVNIADQKDDNKTNSREIYITPDGQMRVVKKATTQNGYMPQYPGGQEAFGEFIASNLRVDGYVKAKTKNVRVRLNFDVTGKIELITYLGPVLPEMETALNKVFNSMPAWIVPEAGGKPVRSEVVVPLQFNW